MVLVALMAHHFVNRINILVLKMEATCSSKMLVMNYQATQHHIPENHSLLYTRAVVFYIGPCYLLQQAKFCLVIRGARLGQPTLLEALASHCIPVMCADSLVMPFQDVLDWKR